MSEIARLGSDDFAAVCAADGEFRLAARAWSGGLRLEIGDAVTGFTMVDGIASPGVPDRSDGVVAISGSEETWAEVLAQVPPRFMNDVAVATSGAGLVRDVDRLLWWQYLPAVQRAIELLRPPGAPVDQPKPGAGTRTLPRVEAVTGRYVRLDLGGVEHRVYVEEAGQGVPVLLQHTAGAHSVQWRHLLECDAITDRFRLIAYDLPFHGKSVPPVGPRWWAEPYTLTGDFLRSVPLAIADAFALDRPVFIGCSVGGLLALDLAARHPDRFRAVVSLEGALHIGGDWEALDGFWHPQVSNETKARMMEGLTAPTSPVEYRKETIQTYAAGWPPVFHGDLWYYMVDYDLREDAHRIDTSRLGVHIFSGEYDYSGTVEHGRAAHEAIPGSTFTEMPGMGHFPMSENPERFIAHLLPILDRIQPREPLS